MRKYMVTSEKVPFPYYMTLREVLLHSEWTESEIVTIVTMNVGDLESFVDFTVERDQ